MLQAALDKRQVSFFMTKLIARGFPNWQIRSVVDLYPWSNKISILAKKADTSKQVLIALILPFSEQIIELQVGALIKAYQHLLPNAVSSAKFITSYTVGKNLFRLRYSRFV